jgi:hypothetical protein
LEIFVLTPGFGRCSGPTGTAILPGENWGVASEDHLLNLHFSGKYFIVPFPRGVDIGEEFFRQDRKRRTAEGTPFREIIEAALRIYHGQNGIDDRCF